MKIMIFIEGTTFYTKPDLYLTSKDGYVPLGKCVDVINDWYNKGHEIFLCSYVRKERYEFIKSVIDYYKINYTEILCREENQEYSEIVEKIVPNVLIEDDCKSIGGEKNWCITNVREDIRKNIQSFIVEEFTGIDKIADKIMLNK